MKRAILMFLLILVGGAFSCVTFAQTRKTVPADASATPEVVALYQRLWRIQEKGTMYGHQDDLLYGHTWMYEPGRSDTKDIVGDYPAVAGFELGEIELGGKVSLDSVPFDRIRERIKWWYKQGGVITISWHVVNPVSSQWPGVKEPNGAGSAWDVDMLKDADLNAVRNVLPGGKDHAMFNSWLKRLAAFFLSLRTEEGQLIPFVFRPWHEHSGSFFWWGRSRCYDEEFASLYRYTVNYLRDKGLHNILYAYNTDKVYSAEEYLKGYPGDDYVDMLSIDWYGEGEEFERNVDKALAFMTQLAEEKGKLHCLSECGPISEGLQTLLEKYKSTYLLTWRHAPLRPGQELRPGAKKHRELLKTMRRNKHYLFLKDIQKIK